MSDETITDEEFERLLDELHGPTGAPSAAAAAGDEITDDEFERLLDSLHGEGRGSGGAPDAAGEHGSGALVLDASLQIDRVAALADRLRERCRAAGPVAVDGSAVERVDTAALQLLAAFAASLRERESALEWSEVSPTLRSAAATLGLEQAIGLG